MSQNPECPGRVRRVCRSKREPIRTMESSGLPESSSGNCWHSRIHFFRRILVYWVMLLLGRSKHLERSRPDQCPGLEANCTMDTPTSSEPNSNSDPFLVNVATLLSSPTLLIHTWPFLTCTSNHS